MVASETPPRHFHARLGKGRPQHFTIVVQTIFGVVERASEGPRLVEVNQRYRNFNDAHGVLDGLHPNLQRHRIAFVADFEFLERARAIGLETAEGIGQIKAKAFVEPAA